MRRMKGMTFLETALALTLVTSFMTGLFILFRSQQQSISLVLGQAKGPLQAVQPLTRISQELSNLKAITAVSTSSIRYTSIRDDGATLREISLAPLNPQAPRSRPLRLKISPKSPGGGVGLPSAPGSEPPKSLLVGASAGDDAAGWEILSDTFLIQNHNPERQALMLRNGKGTTDGPVPIFTALTAEGVPTALPDQIRRIEVYLIISGSPDSPPRPMRTSIALRNP